MRYIEKNHVIHTFSPEHPPVSRARSGETVTFETYDCYKGQLLPGDTTFADLDRSLENPATGPLFVEEAAPGDVLRVDILDISLDPVGILDMGPASGALKGKVSATVIRRVPVQDNRIHYRNLEIPASPMVGVIGVAPESGAVSTMTPMNHGGNMDCTRIEAGCSLYLPVKAPGALLAIKVLERLMERYPQPTYLIILGFMFGSLPELFPGIPGGGTLVASIAMAAAGFFALYVMSRKEAET